MAIQFLRGSTASNDAHTGPVGSFTIDTETWEVRVHDGQTPGGHVVGSVANIPLATQSSDGLMSSEDKTKLDGIAPGAEVNAVDSVNGKTGSVSLNASDVGASPTSHNHPIGDVTNLQSELDSKAPIDNPTFTGVVTIDQGSL